MRRPRATEQKRGVRCPKCGAVPRFVEEVSNGFRTRFEMRRDGTPEEEGVHIEGHFVGVDAFCGCGHRWRLRGVVHADQLRSGVNDG